MSWHKWIWLQWPVLCVAAALATPSAAAASGPRPFAVAVSNFTLELPSHEPPDGGEIVKPALARPSQP